MASIGQFVREVALYWLAYEISGSAIALGILGFCEATPRLLLGAVGGVLRSLAFTYGHPIPLLHPGFWHGYSLFCRHSTVLAYSPVGDFAVDYPQHEPDCRFVDSARSIVGPSIGGMLILWIGVGGCLVFYGVAFLISAFELLGVRIRSSAPLSGEGDLFREFQEGLQYIKATPMILASIIAAYVISIFVGTYTRFLAVFAKDVLAVGPDGMGILMAAPGSARCCR